MNRYRRSSLWLVFLGLLLINTPSKALEVLTFCDSITQGLKRTAGGQEFGVTTPGNGRANFGGYQPRLNQLLDANIEPSTVYNWGTGGTNSSNATAIINNVLNSRQADYILILCGANDLFQGISSNATSSNINFMVERTLAKGVTPIVGELTPVTNPFGGSDNIDRIVWANYNPKIRAVATSKNVPIAYLFGKGNNYNASAWVSDMRRCWKGGPLCGGAAPYTSGDGLHLSDLGFTVMANIWFDTIKSDYAGNLNIIPPLLPLILE